MTITDEENRTTINLDYSTGDQAKNYSLYADNPDAPLLVVAYTLGPDFHCITPEERSHRVVGLLHMLARALKETVAEVKAESKIQHQ